MLRAIAENPEEDTPRLAFADYLDEMGGDAYVARTEFIRIDCDSPVYLPKRQAEGPGVAEGGVVTGHSGSPFVTAKEM